MKQISGNINLGAVDQNPSFNWQIAENLVGYQLSSFHQKLNELTFVSHFHTSPASELTPLKERVTECKIHFEGWGVWFL